MRAYLLTCAARAALRAQTVRGLAGTDWGEPARLFHNRSRLQPPYLRHLSGYARLLRRALDSDSAEHFLILEDDLLFNRYLRHNLLAWEPLREGRIHLASLYDPGIGRLTNDPAGRWFTADHTRVIGSQAFLISRPCAVHLLAHWSEHPFHSDGRIAFLAARLGPIYYHTPSLVQHIGTLSTWDGPPHVAYDFDPDFRA